jgi:hypothetical protein
MRKRRDKKKGFRWMGKIASVKKTREIEKSICD